MKLSLAAIVGSMLSCALAQDMPKLSFKGSAEVRSAYLSRGKVVDARPFSAQFADGRLGLWGWGSVGGSVWSVSSFSREGQSASRRNAYNEADYNLHYDYALEICDEWTLANRLALQWVTLPGYHADMATRREWHVAQELRNPFLTPYFLLRRAYGPVQWCYWRVGLLRRFDISERLSFVVDGFGELSDSRLFDERYGKARGHFCSGRHAGLNALNIVIGVEYKISDNLKAYASVRQFALVSEDARAAIKASSAPQSKRDLTVATVGVAVSF